MITGHLSSGIQQECYHYGLLGHSSEQYTVNTRQTKKKKCPKTKMCIPSQ